MGLDIYLRKCADPDGAKKLEAAYEAAGQKIWDEYGKYEDMTEAQKNEAYAAVQALAPKFGCTGKCERHSSITEVEDQPSTIDPNHMFKIGYFRSSYNEGGIERVLRHRGLPTLHDIFQTDGDVSDVKPDWDEALVRVNEAIDGYAAHLDSDMGRYEVRQVRPMWEHGATDEASALAMFAEQLKKHPPGDADAFGRHYGKREGEFMLDGMKVCAVITKKFAPSEDDVISRFLNRPSVFLIYEKEASDKPDWYLTALRIVRESIEFVLAQPDKQHFYLVWSG